MKKVLLCLLSVLLMLPVVMKAQTEITVGTAATTSTQYPFYHCYEDSWVQSIYPSTLINTAGTITDIAFSCAVSGSGTFNALHIYMGTTNSVGSSSNIPTSQLTEVYSGTNVTVGSTTGWQTFSLTTPFFYDGQSNLVVVVAKAQTSWDCSVEYNVFSGTDSYSSIIGYCDGTPSCAQSPSNCDNTDFSDLLPQMKLTISTVPITCPGPTGLAVTDVNENSANLTWTAGGTESSWDIYMASSDTDIPDENTIPSYTSNTNSYSLQGLNSSTNYRVYVRANCGAGDVSVWRNVAFLTPQVPAQLPYSQDFEDPTENNNWTLIGQNTNKWVIGTAVNATDNGQTGLYISNDNGATNNYSHETSTAWAYRDINFDNSYAEYHVSFDFKGDGESSYYDNLRVYIGVPAVPAASGSSSGACPPGAVEIGNFHNEANWIHPEIVLNSSFTGVQRLYFLWWNDSGGGNPPAAAVDNLEVTGVNCGTPYNLALDTTTQTTIAFTFHPASPNDNSWQVILVNNGDTIDESQAITISDTAYEFTDLTPNTAYQIYVRTDCGSETSWWSSALNVRTDCPEYITIPYTDDFDSYGGSGSTSYFPSCWTRMSTYSTSYPYISSTNYSAPGSLYFYASSSTSYSMIAMPEVDPSFPINTLTLSFMDYASGTTSSYAMQVGVLDGTTFTPVASVYPNAANTWCEQEIDFSSYTGNGQVIAFKFAPSSYYSHYIDNVSLYATPTCLKPVSVSVSNITDNSVNVAWTARNSESEWQVAVVPAGTSVENASPENVYTNPCTIGNLTDNTQYDVYVKAICGGGDESNWSTAVSFFTQCLPTDVIPYTENFDTYGTTTYVSYPNCWTRSTNYSYDYPYISSTHYDGVGSLYFYSTSDYYTLAASQALDLSAYPANSLMLTFKARVSSSSYGRMNVGIMTDASNPNTMTVLKSIYPSDFTNTSNWETFNVILPSEYADGNVYIGFYVPKTASSNYVYVDAVSLDYAPTCMDPTNLQVGQVTGTVAELSWTEPEIAPDSYMVEYSEAGQDNWILSNASVVGTTCYVTGLDPETAYDVRVTSNCNDGTPTPVVANFTTGCLAGGDIQIGNGTASSYYIPVNNYYNYTYSQQIFLASELGGANTFSSISFDYAYSSSSTSKNNCVIYLGQTTQSTFSSSSNYIPLSNLTQVYSGNLNCHQGWNTFNFTTPFQYDGTSNLVLVVDDNSGSYNGSSYTFNTHTASGTRSLYFYSDSYNPDPSNPTSAGANSSTSSSRSNVKFGGECDNTVTCIPPVVQITDVDDESITIDWAPGYTESSWELEYKSDNDATWTQEGTVTTSPYVISNLLPSTGYSVRMRSDCGGDYSSWVMMTAQTECSSIETLPYVQGFESATGSGASHFIDCWRRGTNNSTQYPYTSSSYHHSGNYALYFYGSTSYYSYAATPRFDENIDMSNLQVSFYAYKTSSSYSIEVGIMTDPTDYSTFRPVGTFMPTATSTWEMAEINTSTYTGNGHYVAFRIPAGASNYMYIDDIDIHEIPYCGRVTNIVASQITTTSATISWTPGNNETGWEVLYGPTGMVDFNNDIPTATSTPSLDLSDLIANTGYDVYVRIDCGNGEYGAWTQMTFRTACGIIDALPYIDNFDTYGTGTTVYPSCWGKINTYSSDRPYINTTNYSAPGSMYFYAGSSGTYNIAIMPALDPSIPVNTLKAKFMYRTTNSTDQLVVGVMTNPTDASTFVPVSTVTAASTSTWYQKEVSFASYTGTGQYIAFKNAYTSTYCYAYVDNLIVDVLPSCSAPTNLTFSNISSNSVDVEWTDDPGESVWELNYCLSGQTPSSSNAVTLTTNSYNISNLQPSLTYDVYVRTECSSGDGYSDNLIGSFTTLCEAITILPYTMNFDNVTGTTSTSVSVNNLPMCWDYYNNGTNSSYTGYPIVYNSSTYAASGSNSMRFYAYSSTYGDQYAILPPVDENTYPLNTLALQFSARQLSTSYPFILEVGVMTNPTDPSTFQLMNAFTINTDSYQTQECYFDGFTGTSGVIAMRARYAAANAINYGYVDNVIIKEAPTCRKPMGVAVQGVGSNDVTITWNGDANSNYTIAVGSTATFDPDMSSDIYNATGTTYQITGLNANTTYYVSVQTDCGGGDVSEWTDAIAVLTAANAAMVPYYTDFSDATDNADWVLFNGTQDSKWYIGTPSNATDTVLYVSNDNGATNGYNGASASYVWACRDIEFGNFAEYTLDVEWKCQGESSYDYMYVYIGNPGVVTPGSATAPAGAVLLSPSYMNLQSNYTHFTAALDGSYANTTKRIYLMWHNDGSVYNDPAASVASVSLTGANCGRPHSLQADNIMQTTADISFSPAMATDGAWEYVCGPAGSNPNSLTPVSVSDTLIQLTGLNASTGYVVYVRTDCGGGDYSEWSNAYNFFTQCDVVAIPYTENFDTYGTGESAYPNCWSKINTYSSNRPYVSSTSYAGSGSMYFYAGTSGTYNIAIMPEIDGAYPINTLQATFMFRTTYSTDRMIVGVMTNPTDASTFVPVDTVTAPSTSTWVERTVMFNNYTGTGTFIAFKNEYTTTSAYAYFDNLYVETLPTCLRPRNPQVTAATTSSITLSWTENGSATAWNIEYGPAGFVQGQGTVVPANSNPFTVTGLNPSTNYSFYVQSDCGGGDLSNWSEVGSGATECAAVTLPYTENFDSYAGTTYSTAGPVPTCWTTWTDNTSYPAPHVTSSGTGCYPSSGTNALTFVASSSTTGVTTGASALAILPTFTDDLNTLKLTFSYRMESATSGELRVGYVTNPNSPLTTFTQVAVIPNTTTVTTDSIDFSTVANVPTTGNIAFYWYKESTWYTCSVDDINVTSGGSTPAIPCDAPTALAASNIAQTTATINWTAGGTETSWNLQYKAASAANWSNSITVNNTPTYNLTGLTANTAYQVRVQANCGGGQTSSWTTANFNTLDDAQCPEPTNFRADAITNNSVTLAWNQAAGTATEWEINYKAAAATTWTNITVTTNPYTITDLTPATAYQAQILAHCANGVNSDATEIITFTTLPDGVNNYVLDNSTSLYPNPTTGLFTISNEQCAMNSVNVYDVYGKLLLSVEVNGNVATIDATSLSAGVYFAKVETEKGVVTKRFVKK